MSLGSLGDWLRTHDPGYGALRRAGRAAILMPALFALGDKVIGNPKMSYFIVVRDSFAKLLLVDFQGSRLDRLRSQALIGLTCIVLICLGTLVSQSTVAGDRGDVRRCLRRAVQRRRQFGDRKRDHAAGAVIHPAGHGPGDGVPDPDRVAGWAIAAVVSMVATPCCGPRLSPSRSRLGRVAACRALADRLRAEIAWVTGDGGEQSERERRRRARTLPMPPSMRSTGCSSPRPTGQPASPPRRVRRSAWSMSCAGSGAVLLRSAMQRRTTPPDPALCGVKLAAADVLERAAAALDSGDETAGRATIGELSASPYAVAQGARRVGGPNHRPAARAAPVGGRACRAPTSSRRSTRASERRSWPTSRIRSRPMSSSRRRPGTAAGGSDCSAGSRPGSPGRSAPPASARWRMPRSAPPGCTTACGEPPACHSPCWSPS